jgi:hypothetical protein
VIGVSRAACALVFVVVCAFAPRASGTPRRASAFIDVRCDGRTSREWTRWVHAHSTVDSASKVHLKNLQQLGGARRSEAVAMSRRGLAVCDPSAPLVILSLGLDELGGELRGLLDAPNVIAPPVSTSHAASVFRCEVIRTLTEIDKGFDYSDALIPLFSVPDERTRLCAAETARRLPLRKMRGPLLELVRRDDHVVRNAAALSLLVLGRVGGVGRGEMSENPTPFDTFLSEHSALFDALLDWPSRDLRARELAHAHAAEILDRLLSDQAEAGCHQSLMEGGEDRLPDPEVTVTRLDDDVTAVALDTSEANCETSAVSLVFILPSARCGPRSIILGGSPADLSFAWPTCGLPIRYWRSQMTVYFAGTELMRAPHNVAVVTIAAGKPKVRWVGTENLRGENLAILLSAVWSRVGRTWNRQGR